MDKDKKVGSLLLLSRTEKSPSWQGHVKPAYLSHGKLRHREVRVLVRPTLGADALTGDCNHGNKCGTLTALSNYSHVD